MNLQIEAINKYSNNLAATMPICMHVTVYLKHRTKVTKNVCHCVYIGKCNNSMTNRKRVFFDKDQTCNVKENFKNFTWLNFL